MALELELKQPSNLTIDLRGITPCALACRSESSILRQPISQGNRSVELGELFRAQGNLGDDETLVIQGELDRVDSIGARLARGTVRVMGNVGRGAGAHMTDGTLVIDGNAHDDVGVAMCGGLIRIRGNVGSNAGGHVTGRSCGMNGGRLLVHGNAGQRAGCRMRRGFDRGGW